MTKMYFPCVAGLLSLSVLISCTSPSTRSVHGRDRIHAFTVYWPPPANTSRLRVAVKDLIDMKGVTTTAGSEYVAKNSKPAVRDAECLKIARERNVQFVGKTNLTEFAVSVSGNNSFYGIPQNRLDGRHLYIPGGSSSGSAVAVEAGLADVALGTDTGGSIRVPAACCGIYGLKTTFGLVSTKGVFPISPKHLDTVGPMARDLPHLVQGMDLLERGFQAKYQSAVLAKPSAKNLRIGRLYLDGTNSAVDKAIDDKLEAQGFRVVKLSAAFKAAWVQADKDGISVALGDAWMSDRQYLDKSGVDFMTKVILQKGSIEYSSNYTAAVNRKAAWQRELRRVFQKVDMIAVPTLQGLPPKFPFFGPSVVFEWIVFNMQNTVGVNFAGNPALALPIQMPTVKGKASAVTSLQLVGPRLSEAALLNACRLIETKF